MNPAPGGTAAVVCRAKKAGLVKLTSVTRSVSVPWFDRSNVAHPRRGSNVPTFTFPKSIEEVFTTSFGCATAPAVESRRRATDSDVLEIMAFPLGLVFIRNRL
jgi:hypothetical protein